MEVFIYYFLVKKQRDEVKKYVVNKLMKDYFFILYLCPIKFQRQLHDDKTKGSYTLYGLKQNPLCIHQQASAQPDIQL